MTKILRTAFGFHAFILLATISYSQSTGYINRVATVGAGRTILDPNGDNYSSATTAGFAGNDVANSELPYRSVPSFSAEPFGDLRRGPSHAYSDFVPDANNVGYYTYFDGTNMLFRFRMGSVMSGSKGYSVLLDTDGKFGATGANADPNYQPATTGTNGNPGFEIEIVLETNFRIAIYNVDGTSTPTLIKSYTNWQDMSQVSVAGTFDNGDPDFFIDFYVPFADLAASPFLLTTSTPIRMIATTVMSPQAAIGGPKSDIYGLNDTGYSSTNDEYEAYINSQPPFTPGGLASSGIGSMCTAAPFVNGPTSTGTVTISGSWSKSSLTGASGTATITVYKNGVSVGTVASVSTGSTWTLSGVSVANNDVITARAQATGESMCLISNSVTASTCNSSNRPAIPVLSCYSTSKGITGTNLTTGWTIHVDNITRNTQDNSVTNSGGLFAAPTGSSPNLTWLYSSGCTGGSPLLSGSYKVYYTNTVTGCNSEPVYVCDAGNGGSALAGALAVPTITSPAGGLFTTATTSISGTTDANATLSLYVNGTNIQNTTASAGGVFIFSNLNLVSGQQVYITAELNTGAVSTSKCSSQTAPVTVLCYTSVPLISVDNNNQVTAGLPISGASSESVGTTIKVYTAASSLVSTVAVQNGGTWNTGAYTAVAGTSYYATAQNGTCGLSVASATVAALAATTGRCGTITGPIASSTTSVSGTVTGSVASTTIKLYLDGVNIGSTTTGTTAWGPIAVSNLYSNGVLSIGVQESGKQEQYCSASATTITCSSGPVAPNVSPATTTISTGQTQTYTINNAVVGAFYGLADSTTGQSLGTGVWATSNTINLTTNVFLAGTYKLVVKGTSLTGVSVCSSSPSVARITVNNIALPVTFLGVSARRNDGSVVVKWTVSNEQNVNYYEVERSEDCSNFVSAGKVAFQLSSSAINSYSFVENVSSNGRACYRVKQVDYNGNDHYSDIVSLNGNNVKATLSPNPAGNQVTLYINSQKEGLARLELMDMNGKSVIHESVYLSNGSNALKLYGLDSISRGTYILKLAAINELHYLKLVVQ